MSLAKGSEFSRTKSHSLNAKIPLAKKRKDPNAILPQFMQI